MRTKIDNPLNPKLCTLHLAPCTLHPKPLVLFTTARKTGLKNGIVEKEHLLVAPEHVNFQMCA